MLVSVLAGGREGVGYDAAPFFQHSAQLARRYPSGRVCIKAEVDRRYSGVICKILFQRERRNAAEGKIVSVAHIFLPQRNE
jgi:hypothetical protein